MAEDNAEDNRVSRFAWFLGGVGVGALAGVLYAHKTRDALADNAREGKEYLRNRSKQVTDRVGTLVGRGKNLVGQQQSRVAAAVEAGRQAYKAGSSSANAT